MKRATLLLLLLSLVIAPALLADGMILVPRPVPRVSTPFPLAVRHHRVTVDIRDAVARTSVDQEFYNPTASRLEGMYLFPLPAGAVIRDFAMKVDGTMTRAELLDAAKARGIYEEIVRSQRDPALLEYIGRGAFRVRIFPIEPRSTKRVTLSYSEVVPADGGVHAYTYPLNTEKFSSAPLEDVAIRVHLETSRPLGTIFSPTHDVEIRRKSAASAVAGFEAKETKPDHDFVLYYSAADRGVGVSLLTHRPAGEDGYFLLTVTPAYDSEAKTLPKDVTFVVDTSGSMTGEKMAQARRAIAFCLRHLHAGDRFEIIRFSTEAEAMFGALREATRDNVRFALDFVERFEPIGGTNSEEALMLAMRANATPAARPKVLIFLTDGKPTIGETDEDRLVKKVTDANAAKVRIFPFGVGDDLNTHFLDKLTEAARGARTYVGLKEDLELPLSSFFEKIQSPVLVDVGVRYGEGVRATQTYPRALPDLFRGSQLVILGRYRGTGESLTLHGSVDGKEVTLPYAARFPARNDANELLAPLWAAQRIGHLLDEIRLHGEERELIEEVTTLARRFGIVTPYTSYLIMEDERRRVAANVLSPSQQTLPPMSARMKGEYDAMQSKVGAPSVQASREVEALKGAQNQQQASQGAARMNYSDAKGKTQNLAALAKNVQGRAVYQSGEQWVDSRVQSKPRANVQRVQFASAAYFDLLKNEPKAAEFLALGRNVSFALGERVIEIYE